jgi:hypothetical protein
MGKLEHERERARSRALLEQDHRRPVDAGQIGEPFLRDTQLSTPGSQEPREIARTLYRD